MKVTQSILVASLSVAAHSSVASPVGDFSNQNYLSPRAPRVSLGGARLPLRNNRGLGRRAPSMPLAPAPQKVVPYSDILEPGDAVTTVAGPAAGAAGGLRTVSSPLSGPLARTVANVLDTATGLLQEAPVVGDLTKALPLDSLLQGPPLIGAIGVVSDKIAGLPVLGGPLADTLNSTASLTQALPVSLAVAPDSRTVVLPSYPFHQIPVAAQDLTAAGGAFPIQPSRSLDGLTLPNEQNGPKFPLSQGETEDVYSKDFQEDSHVKTQQESEEDSQVQAARYPDENDQFGESEDDSHVQSQELPREQQQEDSSALGDIPSGVLSEPSVNGHIPPTDYAPDFLNSAFENLPSPPLELSFPKTSDSVLADPGIQSPPINRKLSSQHFKKWWKAKVASISQKARQR